MLLKALPFALSYLLIPLVAIGSAYGGWWIASVFLWGWIATSAIDRIIGIDTANMDPKTQDSMLFWHKMVTWGWVPLQFVLMIFVFWQLGQGHLGTWQQVAVAASLGVATGGIGITFAHEMVHQRSKWERWAGEMLLASTAYGHFSTEHVYGHHIHVGTPKDPVSARKGEDFFRFFLRAVTGTLISAWRIDRDKLAKRKLPVWHRTNPFWRYGLGLAAWLGIAYAFAGAWGLALFGIQALVAVLQLEAVNYVEHYGLTRRLQDNGKFERVQPHHSWNASHQWSNWMLINLQRHSDHHFKPTRRFPLLQHHSWKEAPQLPFSYAVMISIAMNPPIWFWVMNKRVDRWRETFYPGITDWAAYDDGTIGREEQAPDGVPA